MWRNSHGITRGILDWFLGFSVLKHHARDWHSSAFPFPYHWLSIFSILLSEDEIVSMADSATTIDDIEGELFKIERIREVLVRRESELRYMWVGTWETGWTWEGQARHNLCERSQCRQSGKQLKVSDIPLQIDLAFAEKPSSELAVAAEVCTLFSLSNFPKISESATTLKRARDWGCQIRRFLNKKSQWALRSVLQLLILWGEFCVFSSSAHQLQKIFLFSQPKWQITMLLFIPVQE